MIWQTGKWKQIFISRSVFKGSEKASLNIQRYEDDELTTYIWRIKNNSTTISCLIIQSKTQLEIQGLIYDFNAAFVSVH